MPSGQLPVRRLAAIAVLAIAMPALAAHWAQAAPASAPAAPLVPAPLVIDDLGKGTFTLNGPWQFHPGDNPAWASPAFDTSTWEQLNADQPWGQQGHAHLTGFAWYRCSIVLTPGPSGPSQFSLLLSKVRDPYEIYWNGRLIGRNGKMPPRPVWYISQPLQIFDLGAVHQGVLAVRVWKAPLLSDDSGERGGFETAPLIGSPEAIATAKAASDYEWLHSRQLHFGANLLCTVLALLSFLLWLRVPSRWVLFWTTGFALGQPALLLLTNAHLGLPYPFAMGASQALAAMQDISLWFLLLWLLPLRDNRRLCRLTTILARIYLVNATLDGVLVALTWNPRWISLAQVSDAVLTVFSLLFESLPLALVGYALLKRRQFDSARWLVAILAFLDEFTFVFSNLIKQGRQFTAWPLAEKIDAPLFFIAGNGITLSTLAGTLLLAAIVYAVYNSVREDQRRQDTLEREKGELLRESSLMRHEAEHDGLTGLWNHRVIVERLGEEMSRSIRDGNPLCVILVDVDHFKKINDSFGHLAGDLVLKNISRIFTHSLRPYDCVGRYGGEEFLLILPNCEIESALIRAEHLRAAVESASVIDAGATLRITASFGVASALPSQESEAVIRAVDRALYRAKSCGRNCVIQAEMPAPAYKT